MYFTVWLGGHRECWPIMRGVMSLCPCPHSLLCQANNDDNEKAERKKGTLRNLAQLLAVQRNEADFAGVIVEGVSAGYSGEGDGLAHARRLRLFPPPPPISYLVIVVVGQTLAVESHPPLLKNTISEKKKKIWKWKCVWYTHKVIYSKKKRKSDKISGQRASNLLCTCTRTSSRVSLFH